MAEFLTTADVSSELQKVITNARERVILISPYIKINEQLKGRIQSKANAGTNIRIIFGKRQAQDDCEWLKSLQSVEIYFCKDLHAKCFLNEHVALVDLHEPVRIFPTT